ncbi:carbonic anhydrase-related protein 11 [Rhinatrema bivittatum]|uniref:carbonic anhydrase-related protein 11 n=1 Tax=Rhinatrema bivittatum TaxID=194408 RepID=UPI00112DA14A|nr:carbonic anhydrase-related protein 11 [Rhinatrema bivittatum]
MAGFTCSLLVLLQMGTAVGHAAAPVSLAKSYEDWWAYKESIQGIFVPGPAFWGLVNAAWNLCAVGKRQSPIDINTSQVVFDPFLPPLRLSLGSKTVSGTLCNTGRHVVFLPESQRAVNMSGGPLLYTHRLEEVRLHFGGEDGAGSEHLLNKHGSPSVQVANNSNPFLGRLLNRETTTRISFKGDSTFLQDLVLEQLFPDTFSFVTYQGSMTAPPCYETVTWIVIDQALNVTSMQMHSLRLLSQHRALHVFQSMSDNVRPVQPLFQRGLRGTLDYRRPGRRCTGARYRLQVDGPKPPKASG